MKEKRLSIGLFIDTFFPMVDGVVVTVDNYATVLSENHDVVVFTVKPIGRYQKINKPYKIVRSKTMRLPFSEYVIPTPFLDHTFRQTLKKQKFDIVHIHSPFGIGEIGVKYAKKNNIPVISTYHSQYKQDFKTRSKSDTFTNTMMKKIMGVFNKCDMSYAVNRKVKDVYKEYGSTVPTQVRNNGTDLVYIDDQKSIHDLRMNLGIKDDEKVLLFVGRIDIVKNIYFIMNVLKELKESGFKFKMLWIGSGPHLPGLQEKALEANLEQENMYVGRVMDRVTLSKYYSVADLFMFPSLYDASSLVQIEAASQKTPSIFIEGAVTADTIDKNINGYTAQNNVHSFAREVVRIFNNEEEYKQVCNNAFSQIYVTWDAVIEETLQDYKALIEERKHHVSKT
jgi:glycosyltransferase involved in cell wall biosynthesis